MGQERILIAPPRDGAAHETTDADAAMDDDGAQRSKGGGMKKAKVQHYYTQVANPSNSYFNSYLK